MKQTNESQELKRLYSKLREIGKNDSLSVPSYNSFAEISKAISQILAKSWLPNQPEGGEIKQILLYGTPDEVKAMFKKYGVDLDEFYRPYNVTLFVNWDTFYGQLKELSGGGQQNLDIDIPYPPRPMEVQDWQLVDWINNNDPNTVNPTYAYIPLSCC